MGEAKRKGAEKRAAALIANTLDITDAAVPKMLGAVLDVLEKTKEEEHLNEGYVAFALARVTGCLLASSAEVATGEFDEFGKMLGMMAASEARALREANGGRPIEMQGKPH
jgi:hypothetical protein